jgi:hypothetical protein
MNAVPKPVRDPVDYREKAIETAGKIEYGICACGCGRQTKIAKGTNKSKGIIKDHPFRYIHGHNRKRNDRERFEEKIERVPECGCWIWMGAIDKQGYGAFGINGKNLKAHRVSWMFHHGNMPPKDKGVLHRCDIPLCVSPHHFFLGTQLDNIRDCISKKRFRANGGKHGQDHPVSKLSNSDAINIFRDSRTAIVIAKDYGVSRSTVAAIKCGQNWGHIVNANK